MYALPGLKEQALSMRLAQHSATLPYDYLIVMAILA